MEISNLKIKHSFKVGDKFTIFGRTGTFLDFFEGTEKEGTWVNVLYDKMEFDEKSWQSLELLFIFKKKLDIIIKI